MAFKALNLDFKNRQALIESCQVYVFHEFSSSRHLLVWSRQWINTKEKRKWKWPHGRLCRVFIVNFEQILRIVLDFSITDFEQLNVDWVVVFTISRGKIIFKS